MRFEALHHSILAASLAAVAALSTQAAGVPNIQAPGGGALRLEVAAGDRVKVSSEYWRLDFDLRNGGVLDAVAFPHGSGRNLLIEPLAAYVDQWSDRNAPATEFRFSRSGEVLTLEFSGKVGAAGREAGPVEFRTVWTLSPFVARADQTLRFLEDRMTRRVGIASTAVRRELNEWGLRVGMTDDADRRKMAPAMYGRAKRSGEVLFSEHHAPFYWLLFEREKEGFDLTRASDMATWETGLAGRGGAGRYEIRVAGDGGSIVVTQEPLSLPQPVRVRKGEYTFSYYLGLPRIVDKADRKWMHVSFGNHPWPSDTDIKQWAEAGVNIVRLHNDYTNDEDFWHDGAWPPYDEKGMAELRRVIAACHKHNLQVVPYFSIHEFHPKAQGYSEHENAWKRAVDPAGTVFHNKWEKGEFGAQMCPMSGWLDRRKHDIEKAYRELGFDGIYYDWVMTLPCNNGAHDASYHAGTDGVIDLLAWTRRLVAPKGKLILHLYGKMPSIAFENFADLVVNMEEISDAEELIRMEEIPIATVLAESIPRSPCPSYRTDMAGERNRRNIAHLVVLGMFPWSDGVSGDVHEETMKLFRTFKPYRLESYRFRSALSGAVRTSWDDVYGAVYGGADPAVVVIANGRPEKRRNVVWRVDPESLGWPKTAQVVVRDAATMQSRTVEWSALTDGSLMTELDGYQYRIFEVRAAR